MSIELQNIDCNCNNCIHLVRDFEKYEQSLRQHHKWQLDYFTMTKNKLIIKANEHLNKGDKKIYAQLMQTVERMKFQFDRSEAMLQYGMCKKFLKDVSFIPNTCQIDTQECFENRNKL